jgi:potassium efflux system protein
MRIIIKLITLIILLLGTLCLSNSRAQDKANKPPASQRETERHKMHLRDSLLRSFSKSDTSVNSLLQRVEQYTTTFNQINNALSEILDTAEVSQGLPAVVKRINKIDSLTNTHKSSTLRYLFVLRDNLDYYQKELEGWQSDLEGVSKKLIQNQNELIKFSKDTSGEFI